MKIELIRNTYRVRKVYKGVRYTVYFDHLPDKKEILMAITEKMQNVGNGANKNVFGAYCDKYIESKRNVLSPSTLGGYKKCKRCLSEEFKKKRLCDIEQIDVQKEINNYAKDHSPKSVKNLHGFISAVLKMFRPSLQLNTALPQSKTPNKVLPITEEVEQLLNASKNTPYHIGFQLAVLGLRRSEICGAKIEDIDGNILKIHAARIYDEDNHLMTRDNTKTEESTREIYLPDALVEEIKQAGVIYDRTPPMLVKTLHKYQDDLGLSRFTLHDLRAYFASYAHLQGIPDVYIMKMGGWKTDHVLKKIYRGAFRDKNEEFQKDLTSKILPTQ